MVKSSAEVTVNRGETIKTGKRQEVERERGAKQIRGKSNGKRVINTLSNEWNLDLNGICDLLKISYMTFWLTCTRY